jgi:hypothetical protein
MSNVYGNKSRVAKLYASVKGDEEAWKQELVRLYGKDAGRARYDIRGDATDDLRRLYKIYAESRDAYLEARDRVVRDDPCMTRGDTMDSKDRLGGDECAKAMTAAKGEAKHMTSVQDNTEVEMRLHDGRAHIVMIAVGAEGENSYAYGFDPNHNLIAIRVGAIHTDLDGKRYITMPIQEAT